MGILHAAIISIPMLSWCGLSLAQQSEDDLDDLLGEPEQSTSEKRDTPQGQPAPEESTPEEQPASEGQPTSEAQPASDAQPTSEEQTASEEQSAPLETVPVEELSAAPDKRYKSRAVEEIVVTANFREQNIQDVAGSVAGFDKNRIEELGLADMSTLTAFTPSLSNNDRGPGQNDLSIRGIGRLSNIIDLLPTANPVGLYLDDVSLNTFSSSQPNINFWGIQRVEVLRGAQGSLYGESAEGGAIKFISEEPTFDEYGGRFQTKMSQNYRGDPGFGANTTLNVPLGEATGLRFSAGYSKSGGFIDNTREHTDDINDHRDSLIRAVFVTDLTDNLSARLSAHYEDLLINGANFTTVDLDRLENSFRTTDDWRVQKSLVVPLKLSYDFGPVAIESITGHYSIGVDSLAYDPFAAFLLTAASGPATMQNADGHSYNINNYDQFSQELRFISKFEGSLNFVAGAYLRKGTTFTFVDQSYSKTHPGTTVVKGSIDQEADQLSFYTELSWSISEEWSATAGVRRHTEKLISHASETKIGGVNSAGLLFGYIPLPPGSVITPGGTPNFDVLTVEALDLDQRLSATLPMARIEYHPNDDLMLYARYATGVRNGNMNLPAAMFVDAANYGQDPTRPSEAPYKTFDSDSIKAYELGDKLTLLDGELIINSAVFWNDWTDLQIEYDNPVGLTFNAGSARSYGMDLDAFYNLSEHWSLFFGGSLIDGRIAEDVIVSGDVVIKEGTDIPFSQEYSYTAGVSFNDSFGWGGADPTYNIGLNYAYTGPYLKRIGYKDQNAGEFGIFNLSGDLVLGQQWQVGLRVTNVFNTIVDIYGGFIDESYETVTATPPPESLDQYFINRPRETSLTLSYDF